MLVAQLTDHHLRALKRAVQAQCMGSSTHLTEAVARGLGYRTHAALLADLKAYREGRYVRFDGDAFRVRLTELAGTAPPITLSVPSLDHAGRYVADLLYDPQFEFLDLRPRSARFRLSGISAVIRIDLEDEGGGMVRFRRSHAIHTPVQIGPYYPSRDFDDDAAYGMHRAIESLASYHREALAAGHAASETWLV